MYLYYIYIYSFDLGTQFDTFSHTKSTTLVAWSDISAASCPTAIPQHLSLSHHREALRLEPQPGHAIKFDLQKLLDKSSASSTSTQPDSANRSMGFQTSAALCIKFFSHSSDGFASGCTNKDQQRTSHILHQNFLARRIFESVINHADSISGINQHLHSLKKAINHSLRTPGLAANEANVSRRAFPPGYKQLSEEFWYRVPGPGKNMERLWCRQGHALEGQHDTSNTLVESSASQCIDVRRSPKSEASSCIIGRSEAASGADIPRCCQKSSLGTWKNHQKTIKKS